ncbi:MAG: 16S rRNA (adenine(1518)-N(6)/adenine(1519)-N(6))-dimethyltransferase RsmA [Syntrophomonadaceae bacterium]|nr:16S rRNA (adenine(1518)-N(6)/adenine(1519)-N(6))-dimethyltransferase RsmA [Syntrophomonadaceae bacterium]
MHKNTAHLARIKSVTQKYKLHPKKRLGQHFLTDPNILVKIVEACELDSDQYAVEIGAGWGAMTGFLAQIARGVLAVELDTDLAPGLRETFAGHENIKLVFADVLVLDIEQELRQRFAVEGKIRYKVCANLPYYITTPILFHLLEKATAMESAVLMVQKEVAERLVALPGGKDYGVLTIMVAWDAEVEMLGKVSRNCFYPRPGVESAVIRVTPWQERPWVVDSEVTFKQLVRTAFQKRRKTMRNIAAGFFRVDKVEAERKLLALGIEPERRPETLSIDEFGKIADGFSE